MGLEIRWKASDLSILETHPLSPGIKFTAVVTTPANTGSSSSTQLTLSSPPHTASSTVNPNNGNNVGEHSSGLSTGAKAGIGIGAALGILMLAVTATLLLCQQRRKKIFIETVKEGDDAPEVVRGDRAHGQDLPILIEDPKGQSNALKTWWCSMLTISF